MGRVIVGRVIVGRVNGNRPGCIQPLLSSLRSCRVSNNAISLFTRKCLLFRDLDKFSQLQPNYAIISLTNRV